MCGWVRGGANPRTLAGNLRAWAGHGWRLRKQQIGELILACVCGFEAAWAAQPSGPSGKKTCMRAWMGSRVRRTVSPRTLAGAKSAWVGGLAMSGTYARTECEPTFACVQGFEGARVAQPSHPGRTKSAWVDGLAMTGAHARAQRIGELTFACVREFERARFGQPSHPSSHKICMVGRVGQWK